ncbi:basic proline-rich protein-like [Bacillus rossius redtenbacheri]|uniref:basic proline-rich protein-like n=1 Tax=Bacillus rossius redtenbacheri TaxID=93214 RepID=UPI002FDD2E14
MVQGHNLLLPGEWTTHGPPHLAEDAADRDQQCTVEHGEARKRQRRYAQEITPTNEHPPPAVRRDTYPRGRAQGPLNEWPPDTDTDEPVTTPGPPEDGVGALSITEVSDLPDTPTEDCDAETIPVMTEPDDEATDPGLPGIPERERRPYQSMPRPAPDDLRQTPPHPLTGPPGPGDAPGNLPQRTRRPPRYLDDYVREKAVRAPTNVPPPGYPTRDDRGPERRPYQLPDHPGHSFRDEPGPERRPYQLQDHPGHSTRDDPGPERRPYQLPCHPGHSTRDDPGPERRPYQLPDHPGHSMRDEPGPERRPYQLQGHPGHSTRDDPGPERRPY